MKLCCEQQISKIFQQSKKEREKKMLENEIVLTDAQIQKIAFLNIKKEDYKNFLAHRIDLHFATTSQEDRSKWFSTNRAIIQILNDAIRVQLEIMSEALKSEPDLLTDFLAFYVCKKEPVFLTRDFCKELAEQHKVLD